MPPRPRRLPQPSGPGPQSDNEPEEYQLPKLRVNPVASLWIRGVETDMFGQTWQIPAMSAAQWLELLWADPVNILDVFPGLVDAEDEMIDACFRGETTLDDVVKVGLEIITEVSGYDYWVSLRMISALKEGWLQVGGSLIRAGVDAAAISLAAYLTAVFSWLAENMVPKKAQLFFEELNKTPEGEAVESSAEDDAAAFLAAMHQSL